MKQSKKLLSIFLAMLMLLGTVSVIANAAKAEVTKDSVAYDSMDNAALTADQVADLILDMLDADVMPGLGVIDENFVIVKLYLDLRSIDSALTSVYDLLNGNLPGTAGGDVKTIAGEKERLKYNGHVVQRADGDLQVVYCLLDFLMNDTTAGVLSKITGGLLQKGGIEAGSIIQTILGMFVKLDDINNIVMNLDVFVTKMVYDMLIHGSYSANGDYDKSADEWGTLPSSVNTLDKIVNVAIKGLLTNPQEYTYDASGKKVWNMDSKILGSKGESITVDFKTDSVFSVLDKALPIAYETFGTVVLNHDVKKLFMEAMGADFVVLDAVKDKAEIDKIKADSDYINVEDANVDASSVKNYFCNAQMWKVDDTWYFRDYVTRDVLDANGNPVMVNGEVQTAKQHRFQRVEAYDVDELYGIFNWDYYLTASDLDFTALIQQYGSLVGCLNHILYVVLNKAVNPKAVGLNSISQIWEDGGNDKFNENLMKTAKFLLTNFTFMFFGRNPEYVDPNTLQAKPEFVKKINEFAETDEGREGLIAYMLLPFLGDALPQLVYDVDMFTSGLQIEQTAALLVREFLSDLTPQINYDDQIFVDATAAKREFKAHSSAEWMDIILNMGLDLAACYLDNIANFNVDLNTLEKFHTFAKEKGVQPWQVVLEEIVDWAVLYVGSGSNSVIKGLEPDTLGVVRNVTSYDDKTDKATVANNYNGNAFATLSTALNTLLPLGIVNGCSSANYGLDVEILFNKVKNDIIPSLNLEALIGLFGRNNHETNFLNAPLYKELLDLVNQLLGCLISNKKGDAILQVDAKATEILQNMLSDANLSKTVKALLTGLNYRKVPLLTSVLPVLAIFISGWGTEQVMRTPEIDIDDTMTWTEAGDHEFKVINGSKGIWRSYMQNGTRVSDEQYKMILEDVKAYDVMGNASSVLTIKSNAASTYDYGKAATIPCTIKPVAGGDLVRIEITYKMTGADGNSLTTDSLKTSKYIWINNSHGDERSTTFTAEDGMKAQAFTPFYIDSSNLKANVESTVAAYVYKDTTSKKTVGIKSDSPSVDAGISFPQNIYFEGSGSKFNNNYNFVVTDEAKAIEFAKTPGATIEWKVTGYANSKSNPKFKNETVRMTLYDGAALNELRGLVDYEFNQMRTADEYDASNPACGPYLEALKAAARGARQQFNGSSVWNFRELYNNLKAAADAVEGAKKAETPKTKAIDTLEATVKSAEGTLSGKDYRTYMLYRWYKFNDEFKSAKNVIELERREALGVETQNFNYSGLTANEVTELLKISGNGTYADYVKATFTPMTEEEAARAQAEYRNIKSDLAGTSLISLADTNDLITRNLGRLIKRTDKPVTKYLETEIASASALKEADYTAMSWKNFKAALDAANTAKSSDSQDTIFRAKYALQVARNGLVLKGDEADYTELKAVIAQANAALTNASSYENGAADFGAVLAALGYEVKDANGNTINLYPGSAIDVEDIPYGTHDQDEIDDAADELKRALAKLKFKNLNTGSVGVENKEFGTGEFDETTNTEIKESVLVKNVAKEQKATDVAALVKALGDDVTVSLDETYSASVDTDLFVGTGSTITVFKKQGDVKVPVATIKVVVNGDVNGDGVIDVLDCSSVELASHGLVVYNGVYGLAADVATGADGNITIDDVQAVVGLAKAS